MGAFQQEEQDTPSLLGYSCALGAVCGLQEACEEWVFQLRAEGGGAVEQVGEGMSRLTWTSSGERQDSSWHRMGNREGMGDWGRGRRIRTVGFVSGGNGDLVRPAAHSQSITQERIEGGRGESDSRFP